MIFETHAHYDDAKFDTDREMLLADLPQRGISPVINVGSSIATTKTTLSLAQEYPFLYAAVGVHPSDVDDLNEDTYAWLRQQTTLQKTVAVVPVPYTGSRFRALCSKEKSFPRSLPAFWHF